MSGVSQLTMHLCLGRPVIAEALEGPAGEVRRRLSPREVGGRPSQLRPELAGATTLHGQVGSRRRAREGITREFRLGSLPLETHCGD